jgi:predicted RNA-binding protein with PUA-like domain
VPITERIAKQNSRNQEPRSPELLQLLTPEFLNPRPLPSWLLPAPCFLLFNLYSTCYRCVMSQYWLVKQEPTAYSWDQFVADGKTDWTGVRNFQARNNLRAMKVDDPVLYYHSVNGKAVVGIAKVAKEAFRDPTAAEGDWSAVELEPVKALQPSVKIDQIKTDARLVNIPMLKNPRLSVMKLTKDEFEAILELSKNTR